jgi:hypothetical protein
MWREFSPNSACRYDGILMAHIFTCGVDMQRVKVIAQRHTHPSKAEGRFGRRLFDSVFVAGLLAMSCSGAVAAKPPPPSPEPSTETLQHTQVYSIPAGVAVFRQPLVTVPTGYRLTLEFVSLNIDSYVAGEGIRAMLEASDIMGSCSQDPVMGHVLQNPQGVLITPSKYSYNTSQVFKMYVEEDQTLCLHLNRATDTSSTGVGVHLTGQLEPL